MLTWANSKRTGKPYLCRATESRTGASGNTSGGQTVISPEPWNPHFKECSGEYVEGRRYGHSIR